MKQTISFAIALFGWGCLFCHCVSPREQQAITETVENAQAVAQYKELLKDCRSKGRDAGSYDVYQACADEVDAMLCRHKSLRCEDGGTP